MSHPPSSAKSSPQMLGRPKKALSHLKHDIIINVFNVQGSMYDVMMGEVNLSKGASSSSSRVVGSIQT
jgi:hypothetical protein